MNPWITNFLLLVISSRDQELVLAKNESCPFRDSYL